jgi:hypothetical protein
MNNVTKQVTGVVAAVALFATLASAGYLARIGLSQEFGPSKAAGENKPANGSNRAPDNREKPDPIPADEEVWEDYPAEDLDYEPRMADRPGNFEVVAAVARLLDGLYAVEPDYTDMAFPFWDESKKFDSEEAWNTFWKEREDQDRADGRHRTNKLRQYNLELSELRFVNIAAGKAELTNFAEMGMGQGNVDTFVEMRKHHTERCVLVLVSADLESLQSDKVESDEKDPWKFFFVRKATGWKLTYFED